MKASVRKDLLLRLNKLEHRLTTKRTWPGILLVTERIDRERLMTLAEGERIVLDWYQCSHPGVGFLWARERIATNPSDLGRICQPGRCLEDVMRELGKRCQRQEDGSCPECPPGQYPEWLEGEPAFQARLVGGERE